MTAIVTATYLWNGGYHVEEIQRYVDVQQHLWLYWIGLQGQVNRENWSRASAYSQLHAFSIPGEAWHTCHTPNTQNKPQKSTNEHTRRLWRQFWGTSSPVIACTPPQPRKGRCRVAEQSFGMYNIRIHTIVFELSLSAKERNKRVRRLNDKPMPKQSRSVSHKGVVNTQWLQGSDCFLAPVDVLMVQC